MVSGEIGGIVYRERREKVESKEASRREKLKLGFEMSEFGRICKRGLPINGNSEIVLQEAIDPNFEPSYVSLHSSVVKPNQILTPTNHIHRNYNRMWYA